MGFFHHHRTFGRDQRLNRPPYAPQVFRHLLLDVGVPTDTVFRDPRRVGSESLLLHRLKEDACHLDLDRCGLEQRTVAVNSCPTNEEDEGEGEERDVFFADEAIIAPNALFEPKIFDLSEGRKNVRWTGV